MTNPPRARKRVTAIRRAQDGSAFQNCDKCGVMVAIALADMHECEGNETKMKRFKGIANKPNVPAPNQTDFSDQPTSAFRLFMEDFSKMKKNSILIDIEREGFETWSNMPEEERNPYIFLAKKVNAAHVDRLIRESKYLCKEEDEVDSAIVGKFDLSYEEKSGCCDDSECSCSLGFESLETWQWEMVRPWITESSG